jgi:hypothetical protein
VATLFTVMPASYWVNESKVRLLTTGSFGSKLTDPQWIWAREDPTVNRKDNIKRLVLMA